MNSSALAVFKGKNIRRILHQKEWWFSVVDVIEALTDSAEPAVYWRVLKHRLSGDEGANETVTKCNGLKMEARDGKMRETDCATAETLFRIIQSVPSPKAEPFRRWLAKVGYERIQEIEDPELASKRARALYIAKGYPDDWIERRMRSIAIRDELTGEWQKRGVKEQKEYEILTAEIAKATFDVTPSQHKKIKGLKTQNLRDHMTDLELLFSMLGEASTTEIARTQDVQGFPAHKNTAKSGGKIAGNARKQLEKKTGKRVVSKQNYLPAEQKQKRIKG